MNYQPIVFRRIDKRYKDAPSVTSKLKELRAINALLNLEHYLNGVVSQWNRLMSAEEARLRWSMLPPQGRSSIEEYWLDEHLSELDVHFYVICWDKINRNLCLLCRTSRLEAIGIASRDVRRAIQHIGDLRDFYEHLDDRAIQARSVTRTGDIELDISYIKRGDIEGKQQIMKLGRVQIEQMMKAYEIIIEALRGLPSAEGTKSPN